LWIFAVNCALLGTLPLGDEQRPHAFVLRLAGLIVLFVGVALKDRGLVELRAFSDRDDV
jgi:hypothetical protein